MKAEKTKEKEKANKAKEKRRTKPFRGADKNWKQTEDKFIARRINRKDFSQQSGEQSDERADKRTNERTSERTVKRANERTIGMNSVWLLLLVLCFLCFAFAFMCDLF
jgi:hypothetical protein